jgi:phage gpG-like protein
MADEITVTAEGLRELIIGIEDLDKTLTSDSGRNDLVTEIAAALLARIRRRFLAEENPDGVKWEPSKRGQIRRAGGKTYRVVNGVRKGYTGTGTLFETGALFQSLQLGRANNGEINIGTDVPYARDLQEGEGFLPERIFLGFGRDDLKFAENRISFSIEQALRRITSGSKK